MNISAIICEYNPIHKGHTYQIKNIKNNKSNLVVAILSSNFVQRGEPAILSKQARTKCALLNGVDLVLELPVIWSCAPAEKFAFGGTYIADSLGCINHLNFGSESGDINKLKQAAMAADSPKILDLTKSIMQSGQSFAKSRESAISNIYGNNISSLFQTPNNILAIEYIRSLNKLNSNIVPTTIKRIGTDHNSEIAVNEICSSSLLRKLIYNYDKSFSKYITEETLQIINSEINNYTCPASIYNLERSILSKLRCMTIKELSNLPDISEGLQNKIYNSIKLSTSLEELYNNIKSKRYTMSRIKRIIISAFIGITKEISDYKPQYIRVLGFNDNGLKILKNAKSTAKIPIITKFSDIKQLNSAAKQIFRIETIATDLYYMSTPNVQSCEHEKTDQIIKI